MGDKLVRGLPIREQVGHAGEEDYYVAESQHSFYVFLTSWAKSTLGYGRCGAVVLAIAFSKRGAVLYGQVAIKYPHGVDTDGWLLMNERNVFRRLQGENFEEGKGGHTHIVRAVGWIDKVLVDGTVERPALVMEYVDGWTLQEICSRWHRKLWVLMDVIMIRWLIQLGKGLAHLHENKIVHNDLKLHNVMVSKVGQKIKIIDFGMSRVAPMDGECAWETDMAQLGRMVAQLIAQRSPAALVDYENDPSMDGCANILRKHGSRFWGVKTDLHKLFDGGMTANDFVEVMEKCRETVLHRQRVAKKKMKLDGVDYVHELAMYLKSTSSPQLRSQVGGFAKL